MRWVFLDKCLRRQALKQQMFLKNQEALRCCAAESCRGEKQSNAFIIFQTLFNKLFLLTLDEQASASWQTKILSYSACFHRPEQIDSFVTMLRLNLFKMFLSSSNKTSI